MFIFLGKVGITLNMNWAEPAIFNDSSHVEAAETKQQFESGWFANPIFVNGKYPEIMRQKVKSNSVSVCITKLNAKIHIFPRLTAKVQNKDLKNPDYPNSLKMK